MIAWKGEVTAFPYLMRASSNFSATPNLACEWLRFNISCLIGRRIPGTHASAEYSSFVQAPAVLVMLRSERDGRWVFDQRTARCGESPGLEASACVAECWRPMLYFVQKGR